MIRRPPRSTPLYSSAASDVYKRQGLYWLDLDDEAEALAWAARENRPLSAVDITAAHDAVPVLGSGFSRAIYMADVANVRNPRLVKSLKAALLALPNVTIHEHCEVSGFVRDGNKVVGVQTATGAVLGDQVVLTAGAWSCLLYTSDAADE